MRYNNCLFDRNDKTILRSNNKKILDFSFDVASFSFGGTIYVIFF
jgi:hypothetical protein